MRLRAQIKPATTDGTGRLPGEFGDPHVMSNGRSAGFQPAVLVRARETGCKSALPSQANTAARRAFTLLEIMIALGIFAMILTGIYATWMTLMKGGDAAKRAAADVQRSRIALTTLHDAFITALMYTANIRDYAFVADTSGDYAFVSMVARLPASFPGVGRYGDQYVRRVSFSIQPGKDHGNELVMTQAPMLLETNSSMEAYSMVLARDVSMFRLSFYDQRKGEWLDEWKYTNQLPKLVQIGLGLGKKPGRSEPGDVVTTIVSLPANAVGGELQGSGPVQVFPPGVFPPGGVPQGGFPPGGGPIKPYIPPRP